MANDRERPRIEEIRARLRDLDQRARPVSDTLQILEFLLMGIIVGAVVTMALLLFDYF